MIKRRNLDPSIRSLVDCDLPRRNLHVCPTTSGNRNYLEQVAPFGVYDSCQDAMSMVQAYDIVNVWPGNYNEVGALSITVDGVWLRGVAGSRAPNMGGCRRTTLWQDESTVGNVGVIDIQGAHNCEVSGFRIGPYLGADGVGINIGTTAASHGTYIHDNFFYTTETANMPTYIEMGASSYDAQSTLIYRNDFYGGGCNTGDSAIIRWDNATRSRIEANTFMQLGNSTSYIGIKLRDFANHVPRGWIIDNVFTCMEVGGVLAIDVDEVTDGVLFIDGNSFIGHTANANCFDYDADNAGRNWLNGVQISS